VNDTHILKCSVDSGGKSIATVRVGEDARLYVSGVVSYDTVPELCADADTLFSSDEVVTFDLGEVERADSAGLALLIEWMREAAHHRCEIRYINIPQQMMAIARVSGLDKVLPLAWD